LRFDHDSSSEGIEEVIATLALALPRALTRL